MKPSKTSSPASSDGGSYSPRTLRRDHLVAAEVRSGRPSYDRVTVHHRGGDAETARADYEEARRYLAASTTGRRYLLQSEHGPGTTRLVVQTTIRPADAEPSHGMLGNVSSRRETGARRSEVTWPSRVACFLPNGERQSATEILAHENAHAVRHRDGDGQNLRSRKRRHPVHETREEAVAVRVQNAVAQDHGRGIRGPYADPIALFEAKGPTSTRPAHSSDEEILEQAERALRSGDSPADSDVDAPCSARRRVVVRSVEAALAANAELRRSLSLEPTLHPDPVRRAATRDAKRPRFR